MGPAGVQRYRFATPMRKPTEEPPLGDDCQNATCRIAEGSLPGAGISTSTVTIVMEISRPRPDPSMSSAKRRPGVTRSSTILCIGDESVSGIFRAVVGGYSLSCVIVPVSDCSSMALLQCGGMEAFSTISCEAIKSRVRFSNNSAEESLVTRWMSSSDPTSEQP